MLLTICLHLFTQAIYLFMLLLYLQKLTFIHISTMATYFTLLTDYCLVSRNYIPKKYENAFQSLVSISIFDQINVLQSIKHNSIIVYYRKALKAAIVLQPLLGITNSLQMIGTPKETTTAYFAIWSFVTTFLVSYQGFFAALFYCFLNQEVKVCFSLTRSRNR